MKYFRPKDPQVQLYDSVSLLPDTWADLLPVGHFLRKESLALYEQAALPDVSFLYAITYDGSQPVAVAAFHLLRIRSYHVSDASLTSWRRPLWQAFTSGACPQLLVAGHLFRHDIRTFFARPELPAYEAFRRYQAMMQAALGHSCAHAMLLKDPPEHMHVYFQQFAPEYLLMRNDVSMKMDIPTAWTSFDDYEKALKHKYAQRARKVRGQVSGLEIRQLSAAEAEQQKDGLYALYRQVTERQPVRLGYLSPDLLPMLMQSHPSALKVWGFFENGSLVAFASAWVKDESLDMFYIGFDYARNTELQLYFNILFFALEQAISLRKSQLILGRTALEAKARLGCRPYYLPTYLYIRNRVLRNWVARMQQRVLSQEGEWENRHPFRSDL